MHQEDHSKAVQYSVAADLEKRAESPDFNIEEVRNELDALYNYSGLGWAGRGMVKEQEINSSIMAYEAFLFRYGKRKANDD